MTLRDRHFPPSGPHPAARVYRCPGCGGTHTMHGAILWHEARPICSSCGGTMDRVEDGEPIPASTPAWSLPAPPRRI